MLHRTDIVHRNDPAFYIMFPQYNNNVACVLMMNMFCLFPQQLCIVNNNVTIYVRSRICSPVYPVQVYIRSLQDSASIISCAI